MQMTHFAAAATATALIMGSACQAQTTSQTLEAYGLEPGTRLNYETSASLVVGGTPPQRQNAQFAQTYTVIETEDDVRTFFAALDPKSAQETTSSRRQQSPPARFTFQLMGNGEIGSTVAGFNRSLFPGWTPAMDFPVIPVEEASTVTLTIPFMDRPTEVHATRSKSGADTKVSYDYEPSDQTWESAGVRVKSHHATITYSTEDHSVLSAKYETQAEGTRMGQTIPLAVSLETRRTGRTKLSPAQLDALKKDVAAGIPLFGKLQAAISAGDEHLSAAQALIEGYLKDHPEGEFASLYRMFEKEIPQLLRMGQMRKNFAGIIAGKPAPAFEAKTIDGETIKLADLKGKVVLLDFWATWCGPCVAELPTMKKIWEDNKARDFAMIGISGDHEEQTLRDFVKERELAWKQIYQPDLEEGSVMFTYGIGKFPTTVLIDREGIIEVVDARGERLADEVGKLVAEKQP